MTDKLTSFLFIFFLLSSFCYSQGVLENNGPSLKWKQLNTPDFRVIFPEGFESDAQKVANTLQTLHEPEMMGDTSPKKISIVLRNTESVSNGFVGLAPRRSEFFTMPPQDYNFPGTNPWLDLLSLHEYRHIAQFQHSKTGFTKLMSILFGQNTQAGFAFTAAPPWFWEGDATTIETINSRSGRGRIPEFSRVFKTNLLEKKAFNYHKQHLTSFKDFIPDHYRLGYHFVTYLRRETGDPKIWDKVSENAFNLPFIPFTFSNSLKKHTGSYLVDNYNQMMADLKEKWQSQLQNIEPTEFERITNRKTDAFADYSYPQVLEGGSIVVFKDGIGDEGQLVRYSEDGKEMDRFVTGVMNDGGMLSATQYKVVWNEYHFDPRWRAKTYSVIKSHDFESGQTTTITKKSRYAGAAISPDGYKIATTLNTVENNNFVVVIDTYTGKELKRFKNPGNDFYSMVRWSADGEDIVALKTNDVGRSVVSFNYNSETETTLIKAGNENIGHPVLTDNYLFYNSALNGIDNIYALNLNTKKRFQVTHSRYGAYNPVIKGQSIVYNEHTVNGLDIVKANLKPSEWTPLTDVKDLDIKYYEPLVEQEGHADILSTVGNEKFPVKKYSKLGHMLNVHSWGPFLTTDLNKAEVGIFSKDVLSTTTMSLGYTYDITEETGFATAGLSYQGLYPIVDVEVQIGNRTSNEGTINGEEVIFDWKETGGEFGLRIPWKLTKSKYFTELEVENAVGYRGINDFDNSVLVGSRLAPINDSLAFFFRDVVNNGDLIYNKAVISFFRLHKQSKRDINSRWGQSLRLELFNTPYGGDFTGRLFATRFSAYFPSPLQIFGRNLGKHHSLFFNYGYQSRLAELSSDLYYFRNKISKPRGFAYPHHEEFTTLSFNYSLPLWYPDVALGPFFNLQRIRLNGFYDWGKGVGRDYFIEYTASQPRAFFSVRDQEYTSVGAELLIDFNAFRFSPLITLGARYSYLITTKETNIEFLLVNIAF